MRTISFLAAALFAVTVMVPSMTGVAASSSTTSTAQSKKAQCDAERKACYGGKTQTGSSGSRYVAPEDVKTCEDGYRMCVNGGH
jgi:hypothetical protein